MRSRRYSFTTAAAALALLHARAAPAQMDVDPPLPDVLLLLDTSGSMERTVSGATPSCAPLSAPPPESERSRWTNVVEALTGPVQEFSCLSLPRTSSAFVQEYRLGATDPYDRGYYIPFHRMLSRGCALGPGAGDIAEHYYTGAADPCPEPWLQSQTGFLDGARDLARFALMTFDSFANAGTGISGGLPDHAGGVKGMWSYYLGFQGGGAPARGNPPLCAAADVEVGARNPAAPPWEGPLIPFPDADAPIADVRATNDRIQRAITAMRPYGATPLAGMMADARDFLLHDGSTWQGRPLGPRADPCVMNRARKVYVVVLSDGEPNLDLRPECAAGPGPGPAGDGCPVEEPHTIAEAMYQAAEIRTFAVGYSLSAQAGFDCESLTPASFGPGGACEAPSGPVKACCTMARIAVAGGTGHGFFPDSAAELGAALAQIFQDIAEPTSRTLPVFATAPAPASPGGAGGAGAAAYQFATSLNPRPGGARWSGNLERKRHVCESVNGALEARLADVDPAAGDDFAANLDSAGGPAPRRYLTVIGALDAGAQRIWSERTIRPALPADDGLGTYGGAATSGGAPAEAGAFLAEIEGAPRALGMTPGDPLPPACAALGAGAAGECAARVVQWEIGEDVQAGGEALRRARRLGAIYHATPAIAAPPRDLVTDESYSIFAAERADRPLTLLAATIDGQLHAFQVAPGDAADPLKVDHRQNNELWSFFPPAVLPRLPASFGQQSLLLDGAPAVKNVVFERTLAQAAAAGTPAGASWHTALAAGAGAGGGFYYALDITDVRSPRFLWQLSADSAGAPLFGDSTPPPAIATIEIEDGGEVKEIAVAVLAGGSAQLAAGACPRQSAASPLIPSASGFQPRAAVRCWGAAGAGGAVGPARSLTIVRMDTGEVVRTFRGHASEAPAGLAARTTAAPFDSPMTGTPVAYPSQPGQIADRVYAGDADGALWRVDLSRPDPEQWTVHLAWDAYSLPGDAAGSGQPIDTTPIVSVGPLGDRVILFSTGDQESFTSSAAVSGRIWSLTEVIEDGEVHLKHNWSRALPDGQRVTGPISLFDSTAYFATFTPLPASAAACSDGFGSIWGLDYITGAARLPSSADPSALIEFEDQAPGTVVFGVAVTQAPSCAEAVSFSDAYFGPMAGLQGVTEPRYQLVYHTGSRGPADAQGARTRTSAKALPAPAAGVRIASWASVIE
ncbi:MAG: hypothetical protein IT372_07825 [Polyangiaceae bacterium]|nr:hypothetical protein [Polyangiaceae bacterium]